MILYACIVRLQDGLPLSASTDFHPNKQVLECKKWLRRLCVNLCQQPARGTARVCDLSIHFCSAGDISSLTICSSSYQSTTAFSFLEELNWEFSSLYNSTAIALASRPYAFLEFGKSRMIDALSAWLFIPETTYQHLPESPPTRLADVPAAHGAANHRMSPVSVLGILSLTLNIMCGALSLIRGVHLAENSFQDGYENAGRVLAFLTAFSASILQCYLYLFYCPARKLKSWGLLVVIGLCNVYLYGLRNLWQISFHVFVAFLSAVQIVTRRPADRRSDCGV
ncbi:hypothetical protein GDO78_020769 [Eleutherodactylus coqui]|uniref:Longin domain-containing protein n=1 Tax=Eleutherodactylus coqui TaxID=57060 RepID=A0A8J6JZ62_ELECQ|nr:hypothetical protein GDO78_020769 [Eleutherodactylus coqui]